MARKAKDEPIFVNPLEVAVKKNDQASDAAKRRADAFQSTFRRYREGKTQHDQRIVENDRWYRSQHWDLIRSKKPRDAAEPEPTSAYLWNTLANRHGDLMDAFPEPVFVEREESDKPEAEMLSKVVKVVLERGKFHTTYSNNAWYKCKAGTSCYGVFWDQTLEGGMGDISVKKVDLLRLFWEPGVDDVQDSPIFIALSLEPVYKLKKLYPKVADLLQAGKTGDYLTYSETDKVDMQDKSVVLDCYYKDYLADGKTVVHMDKICGSVLLDSTTWHDDSQKGMYWHGMYPFVFDVMFPEEHSVLGFGLVDVIKSPQMYIDKLDQILTRNALVAGRYRMIVRRGAGINVADLMDVSKDVIESEGAVKEGEDYAILQAEALPQTVTNHRQEKIAELKEVSGANDFNRGSSGGGITAASAIMALQEAGNKLSRAMIAGTYTAYSQVCSMIMELIAQYYTEPRKFRITGDSGEVEYVDYTSAGLQEQPIVTGNPAVDSMPEQSMRKPILDVTVHAEKQSPYAALASNERAKEMFAAGMFSPEMAPAALTAMSMMTFDGKERVMADIQKRYEETMAIQTGQMQAQQQIAGNNDLLMQMNEYIKRLTGKDMLAGADIQDPTQVEGGVPQGQQQAAQA